MSILDLVQEIEDEVPRIVIYGKRGIGKSTLAASFPNPLFLLTEKNAIKCKSIRIKSFDQAWGVIKELTELESIPYKTIVIDSVTNLDAMITNYILEKESKATTLAAACGGYGAGYAKAASIHRAFKDKLEELQSRGIAIVYIAHLAVKTHKSPELEDYDIYTIVTCHDKVSQVYLDDSDAVLFCRQKAFISETESGRSLVKSTNQRIITTGVAEVNVSKNRFNMPDEIPMTFNDISKYIPFYQHKDE